MTTLVAARCVAAQRSRQVHAACRSVAASLSVCLLVAYMTLCAAARPGEDGEQAPQSAFCSFEFAPSYTVVMATTLPLPDRAPVTQVGQLYVDRVADAARVDHTYRGQRTSFLIDNHHLRAFLFYNEEDAEAGGVVQRCHVFYLPHKVAPLCVPRGYVVSRPSAAAAAGSATATGRGGDSVVRGVPVTRFTAMDRYANTPLVEQNFYVLNVTDSTVGAAAKPSMTTIPWRLELRARPDLERTSINDVPHDPPNWRLFGHPMFDELALSPAQESQLQHWVPAYDVLTVDFYDFFPTRLSPGLFDVPPQCTAVLRKTASSSTGDGAGGTSARWGGRGGRDESAAAAEPVLELATIQRFLLQWHTLHNASLGWPSASSGVRAAMNPS